MEVALTKSRALVWAVEDLGEEEALVESIVNTARRARSVPVRIYLQESAREGVRKWISNVTMTHTCMNQSYNVVLLLVVAN